MRTQREIVRWDLRRRHSEAIRKTLRRLALSDTCEVVMDAPRRHTGYVQKLLNTGGVRSLERHPPGSDAGHGAAHHQRGRFSLGCVGNADEQILELVLPRTMAELERGTLQHPARDPQPEHDRGVAPTAQEEPHLGPDEREHGDVLREGAPSTCRARWHPHSIDALL